MATTSQKTRRKLSLLKLAEDLGNVTKACQIMGYHRDTFYEVRRAFQVGGVAALVENNREPKTRIPTASLPRSNRRSSTTRWIGLPTARSASPTSCE